MPIYPTGVEKLLMFTKMFHFQISVNIAFKVLNYICESENLKSNLKLYAKTLAWSGFYYLLL